MKITKRRNIFSNSKSKDDDFVCPNCGNESLKGGGDGRCVCRDCNSEFQVSYKNNKLIKTEITSNDALNYGADLTSDIYGGDTDVLNHIHSKVEEEFNNIMQEPRFGFLPDEIDDYSTIQVTSEMLNGEKYIKVEIRAELSFDGMMEIGERLNEVVSKFDIDAYFDMEDAGIMNAYIKWNKAIQLIELSTDIEDDVTAANYGGAFDIDPNQYFTKEEIVELGDNVCELLNDIYIQDFNLSDVYMDDEGRNIVTVFVTCNETGEEFNTSCKIDLRKIRKPSDINRFASVIAQKFTEQINELDWYDSSDTISSSTDVEGAVALGTVLKGIMIAAQAVKTMKDLKEFIDKVREVDEDVADEYEQKAMDSDKEPSELALEIIDVLSNILDGVTSSSEVSCSIEPPLDPPEEPSNYRMNDPVDEVINIDLDAIINMRDDGEYDYEDQTYAWALSPENEEDWYSNTYPDVKLTDQEDLIENVDYLIIPLMPDTPGRYHISGKIELSYTVSNVSTTVIDAWWDDRHGTEVDEEVYTDDAEVEFNYRKSYVNEFKYTKLRKGQDVESATSVVGSNIKFFESKPCSVKEYDTRTSLEYNNHNYALYDISIDNVSGDIRSWRFQLSTLRPYDDADYVWCKYINGKAMFIKSGRTIYSQNFECNEDDFEDYSEWQNNVIAECLDKLEELNSSVEPRIIHN